MLVFSVLAFALAMDSFALCVANGAGFKDIKIFDILKISAIFGFFQAFMPFLGYFLGLSFAGFIAQIDHFVAFFILAFLGIKMIKESKNDEDEPDFSRLGFKQILLGAVATSIDALAVGVTFAFEEISIFSVCLLIGVVCFVLCVLAFFIGKMLGAWLEKKALVLGGVILILLGCKILIEHLFFS